MRILVVGSGGREHALAFKLSQDHEVVCAPGNPGIARDVEIAEVAAGDATGLIELSKRRGIGMIVVGPEDPLIAGLTDRLAAAGFAAFGPAAAAAQLEGSKAFSKRMMREAGVPTASFQTCTDYEEACEYARLAYGAGIELAVKASGTALGRGVTVCDDLDQALEAIHRAMVLKEFGVSGDTLVLEERLRGREFSLLTLVGDHNFVSLPIAQDYKRARDGDQGPNTGGMGSYSPCSWASDALLQDVESRMVEPILEKLKAEGSPFRGTLYTGVLVTSDGPKCLEYNVRFGDPETQTIMMRLQGDLGQALYESATGQPIGTIEVSPRAAATIIVASQGYPGKYRKNNPIAIGTLPEGSKLFFAGVSEMDGALVNSGGRVIGASAVGNTLEEARTTALAAAQAIRFEGAYFRSDIGADGF